MTTMDLLLDAQVLGYLALAATVLLWLVPLGLRAVRHGLYRRRVQRRFQKLVKADAEATAYYYADGPFRRVVVLDPARPSLSVAAASTPAEPALHGVRPRIARRRSPATSSYADDLRSTLRHRVH